MPAPELPRCASPVRPTPHPRSHRCPSRRASPGPRRRPVPAAPRRTVSSWGVRPGSGPSSRRARALRATRARRPRARIPPPIRWSRDRAPARSARPPRPACAAHRCTPARPPAAARRERRGRRAHVRPRRAPPWYSRRRYPSPGRGSLRVIPVLDLSAGHAVLARGGQRDTYAPVRSRLVAGGAEGDPLALARAYRDSLDCDECYVADLDALAGGAVQHALLGALAALRCRLLVDAGVATPERARALVASGAARVVVGLETLPSFDALALVARAIGPKRVVFSLDLRNGAPLAEAPLSGTPLEVARAAVTAGAGTIIVLDLARVGSGRAVCFVLS